MSFFAVLFALLIEQLKPLPTRNPVHHSLSGWTRWVGQNFDAGAPSHARVVWAITVMAPAVAVSVVYWLLHPYSTVLSLGWDVLVLYLTLGFRQFSHHFTHIRDALDAAREERARELLAQWRHVDASDLPRAELLRHVIEYSLLAAHRHVFGVFFWFVILSTLGLGPMGAVMYRMAEFTSRYWSYKSHTTGESTHDGLKNLSVQLFSWIDHVPSRLTAFGFAVVGNFEESIEAWRRYASLWAQPNEGILLAAAAGAVGVRLGGRAAPQAGRDISRTLSDGDAAEVASAAGSTGGAAPQMDHLRHVVALIWRSVVLWMLLLALLSLANLVG